MTVGSVTTSAPSTEWEKTTESQQDNVAMSPSGESVSTIDAGLGLLSTFLGYLYAPVNILARKIICAEPLASFLLKRYVQNKQRENVQWMVDQGKTFDKRHVELSYIASKNEDSDTLKRFIQNGNPEFMNTCMQQSPIAFQDIVNECDIKFGKDHHMLVTTAVRLCDIKTLKLLLTRGAPAFLQWETECQPVFQAVKMGRCDILKLLVEYKAPANGGLWFCGDLFNEAIKLEENHNRDEMIKFLLDHDIFSTEPHNKTFLEEHTITKEDAKNDKILALGRALRHDCSDLILCLILIEIGDSEFDNPELTDDKYKSIYEAGLKSESLEAPESHETSDNLKGKLKSAIIKAHNKLENTRLYKRQFDLSKPNISQKSLSLNT